MPPKLVKIWSLIEEISRHSAKYSQNNDPPSENSADSAELRPFVRPQL